MAQKIQTLFIDDIDGTEADGTVRFALDGTDYEIDLNAAHAADLRNALAKFIAVSRKATGTRRAGKSGRASRKATGGADAMKIREWAKTQGIEVKGRGRVPAEVVTKYRESTGA